MKSTLMFGPRLVCGLAARVRNLVGRESEPHGRDVWRRVVLVVAGVAEDAHHTEAAEPWTSRTVPYEEQMSHEIGAICMYTPRRSKYPIFQDRGPKDHLGYGLWNQNPYILGTWTFWDMLEPERRRYTYIYIYIYEKICIGVYKRWSPGLKDPTLLRARVWIVQNLPSALLEAAAVRPCKHSPSGPQASQPDSGFRQIWGPSSPSDFYQSKETPPTPKTLIGPYEPQ